MRPVPSFYHPPDRARMLARATRLEWITVGYLISSIGMMYMVAGSSQSMKTAWVEDMLSLVPPIAFLIATPIARRRPSEEFPFGYHRATSVAFFAGAVTLFGMGAFLLLEAIHKLILQEHPTIGLIRIFGRDIWLGWAMLAVLAYGLVPVWLGRLKAPLARSLHDHVLHVDAAMNRADWLTAVGAAVGVIGVGLGYWWVDGVAASIIAADITWDGFKNLRDVMADMLDETPKVVDGSAREGLPERVRTYLRGLPWVADADVRIRDGGHAFTGEAFVVVKDSRELVPRIREAVEGACALDWRMLDLSIMPVESLEPAPAKNGPGVSAADDIEGGLR
ncbi:MAG: cation transporter [Acidobacteriota bacterium]|nr:cation transporter [Acidobacteriota bacterium]